MINSEKKLKDRVTREELYQMIWEKPVTKIAKAYGISDNAIRKKCKKLNIQYHLGRPEVVGSKPVIPTKDDSKKIKKLLIS